MDRERSVYPFQTKIHETRAEVFFTKQELVELENIQLEREVHRKTRDLFVFACYTGLSYSDVKSLNDNNIVRGINGNYWIFTKREKNEQPFRFPLLTPIFRHLLWSILFEKLANKDVGFR